jgi:hypothetical protein
MPGPPRGRPPPPAASADSHAAPPPLQQQQLLLLLPTPPLNFAAVAALPAECCCPVAGRPVGHPAGDRPVAAVALAAAPAADGLAVQLPQPPRSLQGASARAGCSLRFLAPPPAAVAAAAAALVRSGLLPLAVGVVAERQSILSVHAWRAAVAPWELHWLLQAPLQGRYSPSAVLAHCACRGNFKAG